MLEERIAQLLPKYMDNSCTPEEKEEFLQMVSRYSRDAYLLELLEKAWQEYISDQQISQDASERIFQHIVFREQPRIRRFSNPLYLFKSAWFKYAAAVLILAGAASFFYYYGSHPLRPSPLASAQRVPVKNDVSPPDSVHATITTGSGRRIVLDDMKDGASSGNMRKISDDYLAYRPGKSDEIEYNTLSVPRGSKVISIKLSDGSQVWLNTGSSLTYPTEFSGNKRLVTITGEAYFEVVKDPKMPFTVQRGDTRIQVLGTHFNVDAYEDEADMRITLLSGSVKVSKDAEAVTLLPGQQARLEANGYIQLNQQPDLEEVMAWKQGRFVFNNSDIKTIMRQIMKWYDVEVIYAGKVPDRYFTADISRNTNLSEVLKVLKLSNISVQLEGKKLIVNP